MPGYVMLDHLRPSNYRLVQVSSGYLRVVRVDLNRLDEVRLCQVRSGFVKLHVSSRYIKVCHVISGEDRLGQFRSGYLKLDQDKFGYFWLGRVLSGKDRLSYVRSY